MINAERSYTEYDVKVPTTDFPIGFDILDNGIDVVAVTLNDVDPTTLGYTVIQVNSTTYRFAPAVPSGVVRLTRITDIDQMAHVFTEGAIFISENMDGNFKQIRHAQQEVRDNFGVLQRDFSGLKGTVLPLVGGLEVALQAAQSAATAAGEAANIAVAVQTDIAQKFPNGKLKAADVLNASTEPQQEINDFGGAKWWSKPLGYKLGATVKLANGDIVKSTEPDNTNDPNVDMTGWVKSNDVKNIEGLTTVYASEFGIKTSNSASENYGRMFQLINSQPEVGALDIIFPAGVFKFSRGFFITRPHTISGVGSGEESKTVFDFQGAEAVGTANYKASIFIAHSFIFDDTSVAGAVLPIGQVGRVGTGAVLKNLKVLNSPAHGIIKNAPSHCIGVAAMHNAKHGILTVANVNAAATVYGGRIDGIANQGANVQCVAGWNGKSGFAEYGDDSNVINYDTCGAAYNGEFGFYGGNLLGSVYTACQAHVNTLGDYVMQGGSHDNSGLPETPANNLYSGCYAEEQRDSVYSINDRSLVINPTGAKPEAGTVNYLSPSIVGLISKQISAATSAQHVYDGKGAAFTKVGLEGIKIGSAVVKTAAFDIYSSVLGRAVMGVNEGNGIVFFLEDFNTTLKVNRPWFDNGLTMGNTHYQISGTAAPTTGTWDRGNIVWNENPAAGGTIGWVCISGGTSGVWKTFGVITA